MINRKGELNKRAVDTDWPYQVALPADACTGARYDLVHDFCHGLSLCPRGHYFRREDVGYNVFCFATKEHAEIFCEKFGGESVEPKKRALEPATPTVKATAQNDNNENDNQKSCGVHG